MECHTYLLSLISILIMFQQLECAPMTSAISESNESPTVVDTCMDEVSSVELLNEALEPIVNDENEADQENQEEVPEELNSSTVDENRLERGEEDGEKAPCSGESSQDCSSGQKVENSKDGENEEEEDSSSDSDDEPSDQSDSSSDSDDSDSSSDADDSDSSSDADDEPSGQSDSSDTEVRNKRSPFEERSLSSWYGDRSFGRRYWSSNEMRRKFLAIPIFTGK